MYTKLDIFIVVVFFKYISTSWFQCSAFPIL